MNLLSNFTYLLEDPVNGDQFEQTDWRRATGGELRRTWHARLGKLPARHAVGLQWRHDRIDVGLHKTRAGERLDTIRDDSVRQSSAAVFAESEVTWRPWLRTVAGLRFDRYWFDVDALPSANTGSTHAGRMSPKLSAILGPWSRTELFLNWGRGFHSNDARGTVTRIDPATGDPAEPVPGLVPANGFELGLRTEAIPGLQSSLSLWQLETDSELVFVGDAGTTEAGRPARRRGVELGNRYMPVPWLIVDADFAWTRARFTDGDPAGDRIPGAAERVATAAELKESAAQFRKRLYAVQFRHCKVKYYARNSTDIFAEDVDCLPPVLREQYVVTCDCEHLCGQVADVLFVVSYKYGGIFSFCVNGRILFIFLRGRGLIVNYWKVDPECAPFSRFAFYLQPGIVALYYSRHCRKSKPPAGELGGVEGVKYVFDPFRVYAAPGIGNLHADVGPGLHAEVHGQMFNHFIIAFFQVCHQTY